MSNSEQIDQKLNIDEKNDTEVEKVKMQFILDENGKLAEIPKDNCLPVEYPIKYPIKNAFEVFVRVKDTENYWISNYGRLVNNYRKKKFHLHKEGNCHHTVYEIERHPLKNRRSELTGEIEVNSYRNETSSQELVAETFLVKYPGRCRIWHKDGNRDNNWYKNLLYVKEKDYKDLFEGKITWQELNYEQEYIEYKNKASHMAYGVYNGIKTRCNDTKDNDTKDNDRIPACYDETTMCQEWIDDPKLFVRWYLEHYYECEDESMAVDKYLFGAGSNMYHPDFCCILPQGINSFLANCKKHYHKNGTAKEDSLPMGVCYNGKSMKYYGKILFSGQNESIRLSDWDTAEEAFAEYKMMKQADICMVAARYKDKVPEYIYKKLLEVDVKPY